MPEKKLGYAFAPGKKKKEGREGKESSAGLISYGTRKDRRGLWVLTSGGTVCRPRPFGTKKKKEGTGSHFTRLAARFCQKREKRDGKLRRSTIHILPERGSSGCEFECIGGRKRCDIADHREGKGSSYSFAGGKGKGRR